MKEQLRNDEFERREPTKEEWLKEEWEKTESTILSSVKTASEIFELDKSEFVDSTRENDENWKLVRGINASSRIR